MKSYLRGVAVQATAIILAALAAAAFSFFQSLAASSGVCPVPVSTTVEVGVLGAVIKSIHTAMSIRHGMM